MKTTEKLVMKTMEKLVFAHLEDRVGGPVHRDNPLLGTVALDTDLGSRLVSGGQRGGDGDGDGDDDGDGGDDDEDKNLFYV